MSPVSSCHLMSMEDGGKVAIPGVPNVLADAVQKVVHRE